MKNVHIFLFFLLLSCSAICQSSYKSAPQWSGQFRIGGFYYSNFEDESLIPPTGYLLSGRVNFRWGDLHVPISAHVNDQGLTYSRPFQRFGLSPRYKALTLHLGHRNLHFSSFVLDRRTIFGVGGELNWKWIRLGFMKGKFTDYRQEWNEYNSVPSFDRKGWAAKVGFGSKRNFVDLVMSTAEDDSMSVYEVIPNDSVFIDPQQNVVFGLKSHFTMTKSLFFEFDAAISGTTRDLSRESLVEIEDEIPLSSFIRSFNFNETSHADYSGQAKLSYQQGLFYSDLIYRRVMPGFESFGVRYLIKDLETITINPGYSLSSGKMSFQASLGMMRNNLNSFKLAETKRWIGSLGWNARWNPNWNTFLQYSNYTLNQQVVRDELRYDSIVIDQISHQINFIPNYQMTKGHHQYQVSANILYQLVDDQSAYDLSNSFMNIGAYFTLRNLRSHWSIQMGPRYFAYSTEGFDSKRLSLVTTLRKAPKEGKLDFMSSLVLSRLSQNEESSMEINLNSRVEWEMIKRLVWGVQLGYFQNFDSLNERQEMRVETFLRWRFGR